MPSDLVERLFETARRLNSEIAQVSDLGKVTYGQLGDRILRFAAALRRRGVGPGDRVVLVLPNRPCFTVAYFGVLALGAVVVPASIEWVRTEIERVLDRVGARAIVCGDRSDASKQGNLTGQNTLVLPDSGCTDCSEIAAANVANNAPEDEAVIFFTSGTTGSPKGAVLSHANMASNAAWVSDQSLTHRNGHRERLGPGHVTMARLALSHSFAQTTMQNAALLGGAAISYPDGAYTPGNTLRQMARDRVTVMATVPTMARALLDAYASESVDLSHFRYALVGGAPIPHELLDAFEGRLGAEILEGYGLTETSPVCAFRTPSIPRRAGSVGRAAAGAEISAVNADDEFVDAGEMGELVVRGEPVFTGYLDDDDATRHALRKGWLHTGDVGRVDADGYVYVVDRLADIIIRNGYNISPAEVESILELHPGVAEAIVIGQPDNRVGEELVACIVPERGAAWCESAIREHCAQHLAAYKRPRHYRVISKPPRGEKGQVLRHLLRDLSEDPEPASQS